MDALSNVLSSIRLQGAMFLSAEFSDPWCVATLTAGPACRALLPQAKQVIPFHLVTRGRCVVYPEGGAPVEVQQGQAVIFPHGTPHRMGSQQGTTVRDVSMLIQSSLPADGIRRIAYGGGGEACVLQCGFLACDPTTANPLLEALPDVLVMSLCDEAGASTPFLSSIWSYAESVSATAAPGTIAALAKLSELLFIEAVRRYVADLPEEAQGWVAGLRDPLVARTLALIHQQPEVAWTLDTLARKVGSSRSVISERFAKYLGCPPMTYLSRWRMQVAAHMLDGAAGNIDAVSRAVGYGSQSAFCRAFAREYGVPPSRWRGAH